MHELSDLLTDTIQAELLPQGFERDGAIWYKERDGIVAMLALVHVGNGKPTCTINLGVHVRALAQPTTRYTRNRVPQPIFGDWDVYGHLDYLDNALREALDGRNDWADALRQLVVRDRIKRVALPMLSDLLTKEQIARTLAGESPFLTTRWLRDWLAAA